MRGKEKVVRTVNDLLVDLSTRKEEVGNPIWFRGHANKDWVLTPTFYRDNDRTEMYFLKKFKQMATLLVNPKPSKSYEWMFIMRHHNIPSRLLDWTESPLVALFFTVNYQPNKDGALWALLPKELNRNVDEINDDESLPSFDEDDSLDMYTPKHLNDEPTPKPTIAIIAPRNSNRMQAQLSTFTINHTDERPIDEIGDRNHVWKYIIPKEVKENLKRELCALRITYFQLFPEIGNIVGAIEDE